MVTAIVHRSLVPKWTPPALMPLFTLLTWNGVAGGRLLEPPATMTPVCKMTLSPIVIMMMAKYRPADHRAKDKALKCQGDQHRDGWRDQQGKEEVEMPEKDTNVGDIGAYQEKFTLGKVDDSTGLEDNGESESDQRIDAAQGQTSKD